MMRDRPKRVRGHEARANFALRVVAFGILVLALSLRLHPQVPPKANEKQQLINSSLSALNTPSASPTGVILEPDARKRPYITLIGLVIFGVILSFARLIHKFRRFWSLGVVFNVYTPIYSAIGALPCFLYLTRDSINSTSLISIPTKGLTEAACIAGVLLAPICGRKSRGQLDAGNHLGSLGIEFSRNPVFAVLEEKIEECIGKRMHERITTFSKYYSWDKIKSAAHKTLNQEHVLGRISDKVRKAQAKQIDKFPSDLKESAASITKYDALHQVLIHCSFRRLRYFLTIGEEVTEP